MKRLDCECEADVLAAVNTGRWPDRADADLRAHVAVCAICQDVVAVAEAFAQDASPDFSTGFDLAKTDAGHRDRLPDASRVWLRAQIRAREDATRLAARPITVAQAVAFASVVGLLGALLGATSSWLQGGMRWLTTMAARIDPRGMRVPDSIATALAGHELAILVVVVCLALTPVAVYVAVRQSEREI